MLICPRWSLGRGTVLIFLTAVLPNFLKAVSYNLFIVWRDLPAALAAAEKFPLCSPTNCAASVCCGVIGATFWVSLRRRRLRFAPFDSFGVLAVLAASRRTCAS